MKIPAELVYTETDEWVKVEGTTATIGVTDYAQDQLSDVVFVEICCRGWRNDQQEASRLPPSNR